MELLVAAVAAACGSALGAVWMARRRPAAAGQQSLSLLGQQLTDPGTDQAVRLAAIAAIEQHGVDNPTDRQTVIDLICQHLRSAPPAPGLPDTSLRAALRVLRVRLHRSDTRDPWPPLHLDLSGAHLHELDLSGCMVGELMCRATHFHGTTRITNAIIDFGACFEDAVFCGYAEFNGTYFGSLRMRGAHWQGGVDFKGSGVHQGQGEFLEPTPSPQDSDPSERA